MIDYKKNEIRRKNIVWNGKSCKIIRHHALLHKNNKIKYKHKKKSIKSIS